MAARSLVAALAALFLTALVSPGHAQTTVFSDDTFLDANWTITTEILNLGGTASGSQIATGGNPGPYRQTVNTLNSALGFGFSNTVFSFHQRAGATFSPATSGPIASIDYSEASIRLAAGVQACALALWQGGVIYYGPGFLTPSSLNTWVTTSQTGLTATSFDAAAPGIQNPDFGVGAPPIAFGFSRSNSTSVGGDGSTLTGGIDNWTVSVHYLGATSTHSTSWGRIKELYSSHR